MKKELEQLINYAIADGVITDKEREILRKKAFEMGVDPDEVEMVLEGRLGEKMQRENFNALKSQMRKCPSCGEIIPITSGVCSACGFVFDNDGKDIKLLSDLDELYENISKSDMFSYKYLNLTYVAALLTLWCYSIHVGNGWLIFLAVLLSFYLVGIIIMSETNFWPNSSAEKYRGKFNSVLANAKYIYSKDKKINDRIENIEKNVNKELKIRKLMKNIFYIPPVILCTFSILMICLPNTKYSAEDCNKKVLLLLDEGNIKEAFDCIMDFKGKYTTIGDGFSKIHPTIMKIIPFAIKGGFNEEIKSLIRDKLDKDSNAKWIILEIFPILIELDNYDLVKYLNENYDSSIDDAIIMDYLINKEEYQEAGKYMSYEKDKYIEKVVRKMCELNKKSDARRFLKTNINLINNKEERQEVVNKINMLINNY